MVGRKRKPRSLRVPDTAVYRGKRYKLWAGEHGPVGWFSRDAARRAARDLRKKGWLAFVKTYYGVDSRGMKSEWYAVYRRKK